MMKIMKAHWHTIMISMVISAVAICLAMLIIDSLWITTGSPLYLNVLYVNKILDDVIVIGLALTIIGYASWLKYQSN